MSDGWVFDRREFAARAALVAKAAERGLTSVWFTPEGVEFSCADTVGARISVRVPLAEGEECDEAVAGVLSAAVVAQIAKGCQGGQLTIRAEEGRLRVSDGRTDATAVFLRGHEPMEPLVCPGGTMVSTGRLIAGCKAALAARGGRRVAVVFSGVQFLCSDNGATYVIGTDQSRLHRTKLGWQVSDGAETLTVPAASVELLMRGLSGAECEVSWRGQTLTIGDDGLCVEFAGYQVAPVDTRQVVKPLRDPEVKVRVQAAAAAAAVKRIAAMVPNAAVSVTARPDSRELEIAAQNEFGFAASRLPAYVSGSELTVVCPSERLVDALSAIRGNAELTFADRFQMFQVEGRQFLAVIAPVRGVC